MRSALQIALVGAVLLSVAVVPTTALAAPADAASTHSLSTAPESQTALQSPDNATDRIGAPAATGHDACAPVANGSAPPDPATDRLGWEAGCWYNESLAVTPEDGFNETELAAAVNRTRARLEHLRGHEFEDAAPVEVISREAYADRVASRGTPDTDIRQFTNTKWEATFFVNESTPAVESRRDTAVATVGGFYSFGSESIVIISENTSAPKLYEPVLSQELYHALQDRQFGFGNADFSTRERHNAVDGLFEGDANFVQYRYQQRCDGNWSCLIPSPEAENGSSGSANTGINLVVNVPYSEGTEWVRERYRDGGWDAIDTLYERPPVSSEQLIHPERYPDDQPVDVAVTDRSGEAWQRVGTGPDVGYESFGEGGLFAMLWYPSLVETLRLDTAISVAVPFSTYYNFKPGTSELKDIGWRNYSTPATDGWNGDRLVPYASGSNVSETAYVWQTQWDTERDAREFRAAYGRLLEYHNATAVDGHTDTYRIPEETAFADAFYVNTSGSTVTIVNAPTVDQLDDVRAGAAPESSSDNSSTENESTPTNDATATDDSTPTEEPTGSDDQTSTDDGTPADDRTQTDDQTPTEAVTDTDDDPATATDNRTDAGDDGTQPSAPETETTSDGGPGFGVVVALVAVVAAALAARRRR